MITKENYELYLFDLVEGNLSPQEVKMVEDFLHQHPELKAELDAYRSAVLEADMHVVYENKDALKRQSGRRLIYMLNPYYSAAAVFAVALGTWWILRAPHTPFVSQAQQAQLTTIPQAETETNADVKVVAPEYENFAPKKKRGYSAKQHVEPQVKKKDFMAVDTTDVERVAKRDTSVIKKDAVQKQEELQQQERLAVVVPLLTDSSINIPGEPKNTESAVLPQPNEIAQASVQETTSLKERMQDKLSGWLSYLSKPTLRIQKVKEDDKTRIRIELENQRFKVMGSMKAEL